MGSEAVELEARNLYIEGGLECPEIAATIGVTARTVQRWARTGDWEVARVAYCRRRDAEATREARAAAGDELVITRAQAVHLLWASISLADPGQRAPLFKVLGEWHRWADPVGGLDADVGDGPPTRVRICRSKPTGSLDG